jgi:hypothetical protein
MESVEQRLIRRDDHLALLFSPPFDRTPLDPGYVKGYVAGIRENGGQYTHAAVWSVVAFAMLGEGDKAVELFDLLSPIHHASRRASVHRYKVEPYAVVADVYSQRPHVGRGEWTASIPVFPKSGSALISPTAMAAPFTGSPSRIPKGSAAEYRRSASTGLCSREQGSYPCPTMVRSTVSRWCWDRGQSGRGARIRTEDFLLPKQARYRAAPRPDKRVKYRLPEKAPQIIPYEPGTPLTHLGART